MHVPHLHTGGRYPVLRSLAILYLVCAGLAAVLGVVAGGWVLMELGHRTLWERTVLAGMIVGGALLSVITLLAIAEGIKLFIDIAEGVWHMRQRVAGREERFDTHDEESAEMALVRGH